MRTTDLGPPALGPVLLSQTSTAELRSILAAIGFDRRQTLSEALTRSASILNTRNNP